MRTVGVFEAKNKLSELIGAVEKGETVLLTRNGQPVAELVPVSKGDKGAEGSMKWLLSRRWKLAGIPIKELINAGRRS